jgi:hypothetical protein
MKHDHSDDTTGNLRIAVFLNLGFTLLEIVSGFRTNAISDIAKFQGLRSCNELARINANLDLFSRKLVLSVSKYLR